ncbi:MAG: 6-pyruvoyl tetrahydropterin synthase family protein [Dehalococcoidia bacterium]
MAGLNNERAVAAGRYHAVMNIHRRVTVERNRLRFAAAHMATFHGDCEPLHGHNYDVLVEVSGDLTQDSWVWDFGDLKRRTKAIADELDHKFLLQAESTVLDIAEQGDAWEVGFQGRRYQFPKSDVVALSIDNTTAERLAEWIAERLRAELVVAGATTIREITVGVEEMPGQAGWYTVSW